jgi:hypothetical protein
MNEFIFSEAGFDFSKDSLVRASLLKGLLSRQTAKEEGSRTPVSLSDLTGAAQKQARPLGAERELPSKDKGRGL